MASNAAMGMHTSGGTGCKRGGIAETDTDNGEAEVSEIIERAAKALENLDSSDFHERQTKDYTEMARAVLKAIREPSGGMILAANLEDIQSMHSPEAEITCWQAMIDAALNQ